jgi:hypothetical protein
MNRQETHQRLIEIGSAAERLPIDGQFNLSGADLREANLSWADLSGADLSEADLRGADLSWANLSGADLSGANLRGADLRGANLREADLRWADLSGAVLSGANLRGAAVSWQSHDLVAELLRRAAGDDVPRRMLAGLVLVSRDWCWNTFLALDIDPALRDWALTELRRWVTDGDNAPEALRPPVSDQSTPPAA